MGFAQVLLDLPDHDAVDVDRLAVAFIVRPLFSVEEPGTAAVACIVLLRSQELVRFEGESPALIPRGSPAWPPSCPRCRSTAAASTIGSTTSASSAPARATPATGGPARGMQRTRSDASRRSAGRGLPP